MNRWLLLFVVLFTLRNVGDFYFQPRGSSAGEKRGLASLVLLVLAFVVSGFSVMYHLYAYEQLNLYLYVVGALLFIAGFAGRVAGLRALRHNYSPYIDGASGKSLVTNGVYSTIRHPLYAFYIVELAGMLLIKFNYLSLAAVIIVIGTTVYRIRREERYLCSVYGKQYEDYCRDTSKLVPFVY